MAIKTFASTCNKPYDRHKYKLTLHSGKSIIVDDYEMLRALWFQYSKYAKQVDVLD